MTDRPSAFPSASGITVTPLILSPAPACFVFEIGPYSVPQGSLELTAWNPLSSASQVSLRHSNLPVKCKLAPVQCNLTKEQMIQCHRLHPQRVTYCQSLLQDQASPKAQLCSRDHTPLLSIREGSSLALLFCLSPPYSPLDSFTVSSRFFSSLHQFRTCTWSHQCLPYCGRVASHVHTRC